MDEFLVQEPKRKRGWTLSPGAFRRLLNWLDGGGDSAGREYVEMRRRLVAYFDRKNCPAPEDLADETLNRVARRLEEEGAEAADAPARYCYIVARFVFMEHLRESRSRVARLDAERLRQPPHAHPPAPAAADVEDIKEKMLDCLERCTGELDPRGREIIIRYYAGKGRAKIENRRSLAAELGITVNALSIRACRIRDKLEACVKGCVGAE